MISINQFKCKIGKYDLTCELNGNDIGFRVECMTDLLLYEGFYNNDTLPYQCKTFFNHSAARLYNYLKDKPSSKLKFNHCELIVTFQLIGQQKHLQLYIQQKQPSTNDLVMAIQNLNRENAQLRQQNASLLRDKKHQTNTTDLLVTIQKLNKTIQEQQEKYAVLSREKRHIEQKYASLKDFKHNQQIQQKRKIDSQAQKILHLQSFVKVTGNQPVIPSSSNVIKTKKKADSQSEYEISSEDSNKCRRDYKSKPLQNMTSIKDQFVIVWKQKKDITDKIQHLSRFPDCLTVKISGKQGENGNQGIKELSEILPRVQQLKNIMTLNLYFNNHQFGKGVSVTFWQVLRATIIAHLKIRFFNIIVGPKTWKQNQKILQKQIQLYPKKITVNIQIQGWK